MLNNAFNILVVKYWFQKVDNQNFKIQNNILSETVEFSFQNLGY